ALVDVVRAYAALALDFQARTDEALQTSTMLSETAILLASIHDPEDLLEALAGKITEAIGCDWGAVYLLDDASGELRYAAGAGVPAALETLRQIHAAPDRFEIALSVGEDGIVEVTDLPAESELTPFSVAGLVASCLAVPLRRGPALVGALTV